jgi:hypothetical protein
MMPSPLYGVPGDFSEITCLLPSYVIEQYRHSFGILDTNGNLICHMGRYGNRDSGERLVAVRIEYHAEETAPIGAR